jgi:protocatechuate 3,4-dioxygenase beta subunit
LSSLILWAWLALTTVSSPQPPSLSGTVVDPEGKPVKGATVWLTRPVRFDVDVEDLAQVETDAEGRFAFDTPVAVVGDRQRFVTLWAHSPGKRVAILSPAYRPKDEQGPIRLALGAPARTPVRVRGIDGKLLAGATVRPTPFVWPTGLRARLEATTDAQGLAAIEGVNPGQIFRIDVTAEGLGTQGHNVPQDEAEKAVQLLPLGRVTARIVSDNPKALAGWTVIASSHPPEASNSPYTTNASRGRSDETGQVALGQLAAGRIAFRFEPPEGSPFLPLPAAPAQVALRGSENIEVKIPVRKGVKVEGSVLEHGGKPAAGVKVNLYVLSPYRRNENVVTDAEGRFSRYFLPCKLRISMTWFELPDRYFHAPDAHWADHDLAANEEVKTLAPLEVWPAVSIKGTVVDESGKPAEGVQVAGSCIARQFGDRPIPGNTQTDEHGNFVLGRMAPDSTVQVRGLITSRAETEPVTVRLDGKGTQDRPVALKIVKRPTVALRGRVLGPAGQPIAGVRVTIAFRTGNEQNGYGNGNEEEIRTGPDGTFQTPDGVPRSDQYRIHVTAPGMDPGESAWAKAPNAVLPDLILRRTSRLRSVAGRVVDSDGRGVAGAEVFQSGDGPRRTSDTTDLDGRFTIPGVFDAPAFVFVKKPGYRFTGRRIGAGDEPVAVVVSKVEGPASAPLKSAPSRSSRAEEQATARGLIAPVWKDFKPGEAERPDSPAPTLALVDTARVVGMIEDQVLKPSGPLLEDVALGLYEGDPRAAVATLAAIRPPAMAAEALLGFLDRVPDMPAGVRNDLLTRALALARGVTEPARRVALTARVADRRFAAGEPEKARPVLEEARAVLKRKAAPAGGGDEDRPLVEEVHVVASGSSLADRVDLADALARVDLPAALALLEPGKDEAHLASLARRAASNDPAGAERVFVGLTQRRVKLGVMADLCAGMAEKDLRRAVALPTRAGSPGVAAHTLATAARYAASADPAGAKKLLAEAYDRLEPLSGMIVIPPVSMARLLPLAVRVDPDRSSEYFWRAIAARPPRASGLAPGSVSPDVRQHYLVLAQLAALIARYDVETARAIFAPVAENAQALFDERFGLTNEAATTLQAAAAFDQRAALALIDAIPEDPEPKPAPQPGGPPAFTPRTKEKARLVVARALALPPAARLREALRVPGQFNLWPSVLDD